MTTTMTMRTMLFVACASAITLGCDGEDGDVDAGRRDSGMARVDAGPPDEDAGPPDEDAGTPDEDAGTPDEDGGPGDAGPEDAGSTSEPPTITMVAWTAVSGCAAGTASDVTITVTVTDPDTAAGSLTFSGSATGCTGTISAATSTVNCPNLAPYPSTVTVMDPDGNSDTESFTFGICETGSASF